MVTVYSKFLLGNITQRTIRLLQSKVASVNII